MNDATLYQVAPIHVVMVSIRGIKRPRLQHHCRGDLRHDQG